MRKMIISLLGPTFKKVVLCIGLFCCSATMFGQNCFDVLGVLAPEEGGFQSVPFTGNSCCTAQTFRLEDAPSWITGILPVGGFGGNGELTFTVAPNNTGALRSGDITYSVNNGIGSTQCIAVRSFGTLTVSQAANTCTTRTWYLDRDEDGFRPNGISVATQCDSPGTGWTTTVTLQTGDCNDNNDAINPNTIWYFDMDGDGHASDTEEQCSQPTVGIGWTTTVLPVDDCDDNDFDINPDTVWYFDADNDGFYPLVNGTRQQCTSPGPGWTTQTKTAGDCNDNSAALNPNTRWYLDADGDGHAINTRTQCTSPGTGWTRTVLPVDDCNDGSAGINPDTVWYLDADNDGFYPSNGRRTQCASPGTGWTTQTKTAGDCNDGNSGLNPNTRWYLDADGDGHAINTRTQCTSPGTGWTRTVLPVDDCNDGSAGINPDTVWYLDGDNDGFFPNNGTRSQCTSPGTGWTTQTKTAGDCNDGNSGLNPNTRWYLDADGDGHAIDTRTQCTSPGTGWTRTVLPVDDCNDGSAGINPDTVWYLDGDNDGFYPAGGRREQCTSPGSGWTTSNKQPDDCNDNDATLHPNTEWYPDTDGDGFADPGGTSVTQCTMPSGSWTLNPDENPCQVSAAEKQALIELYNETDGPNWTNSWDIVNTEPCDWFGVTVENGLVTSLRLSSNNLNGSIPTTINSLPNITDFSLDSNQLSGSIPRQLGELVNLDRLQLFRNQLTGPIPMEFGNFLDIRTISLFENQLSGIIPETIGNLTSLESFLIYNNQLTGVIPSQIGQLTALLTLDAHNNRLTGSIPTQIGQLTSLRNLTLYDNQFTGTIPAEVGQMSNLEFLYIYDNQLSGIIPEQIGQAGNLKRIYLHNNQLTGEIPTQIGGLTNLEFLWLHNNLFDSQLPATLESLSSLEQLRIQNNNFFGNIPSSLNNLQGLNHLDFGNNNFVFSNFEDDHPSYSNFSIYGFSPQAKVDQEETLTVPIGGTIPLSSMALTSPDNRYQWFKDGQPITGVTADKDYVIANATAADAGVYHFEATNITVMGLTLTRNTITVNIGGTGQMPIIQQFCSVNGQPTLADISFGTINGFAPVWYLSQTGGIALPLTTIVQEGVTYWADDTSNGNNNRVAHAVVIDENVPVGAAQQSFDFTGNPTLASITVQGAAGTSILWFDAATGGNSLPSTTPLVDRRTYFAQSNIAGNSCRLAIRVRNTATTEICEEMLNGTGSGGASIIDGSFENAENVIIPNKRNETLGNSGWGATQGTPDTFATPYNANIVNDVLISFNASPNGGICAGGLIMGTSTEGFAANISGLSSGIYVVEFYQANATNVMNSAFLRQASGFWQVTFGGLRQGSALSAPSTVSNPSWSRIRLEFNVSSPTQLLDFTVGSSGEEDNAYPVYMLIDGIRVYRKPAATFTTVCYDLFTQVFCNYPDDQQPTVADLESPLGINVAWYTSSTGGDRVFSNESLTELETDIFWADNGTDQRVATEIVFDLGAPTGEEYQFFDIALNPTLENIVVEGTNITWHSSFTGNTVLPLSTPLANNGVYYAAQSSNECRLQLTVGVGIPAPLGSEYQEFCSANNPTVADLDFQPTNPDYTIQWYSSATGGSLYNSTDALVDGQTYYVAQTNGNANNESRIPVLVSITDVIEESRIEDINLEMPTGSTVQDLVNFFSDVPNLVWYNDAFEGTAYGLGAQLINGETYYGRFGENGICGSFMVLAVTISVADVEEPELITCMQFIPTPNRRYVIGAWAREQPVIAEPAGTASFSDVKDSFIQLLEFLTGRILNRQQIPPTYVLKEDPDAPDVDDLLPFVRNTTDRNLTVYNFRFEKETIGGVEKSIGYSFALAEGSNERFVFLMPLVRSEASFVEGFTFQSMESYRLPIRNYEGLQIRYTDVGVVGGKFRITANVSVPISAGLNVSIGYPNHTADSFSNSGIDAEIQLMNYIETESEEPAYYNLTSIELEYRDKQGNVIVDEDGITEVLFEPTGAVIDGWQRIQGDFDIPGDAAYMKISLRNKGDGHNAYFDDVRILPFESNMKSFVYDPITQRLMAELDENNYATFYEYDTEGGLVRVKKETERGVYTIQETRSGNSKLNISQNTGQ